MRPLGYLENLGKSLNKSNKPWIPVIITDAEKRTIEKQAEVMIPHLGRLADIYATTSKTTMGIKPEKRRILETP